MRLLRHFTLRDLSLVVAAFFAATGLFAQSFNAVSYGPHGPTNSASLAVLFFHHYDAASNSWQATMALQVTAGSGLGGATFGGLGVNTNMAAGPRSTGARFTPGFTGTFGVNVADPGLDWGSGTDLSVTVPDAPTIVDPDPDDPTTNGDPVQLATGREVMHRTLFKFSGARDWEFALNYDSRDSSFQPGFVQQDVPRGWTHNFATSIAHSVLVDAYYLMDNYAARQVFYVPSTSDPTLYYTAPVGSARYDTLKVQTDGKILVTHRDQSSQLYDGSTGRLLEDRDPQGRKLVLAYTAGRLTSITDPVSGTGVTVTAFTLDGGGSPAQFKTLTDSTGATVQFDFDATYNGHLSKITNQNGKQTTFGYDWADRLNSITDDLGQTILTNTYSTDGKMTAQLDGVTGHSASSFAYGSNATTFTDRLGKQTAYTFDANHNTTSITDPLGHATSYGYNTSQDRTSATDPLSHATSYTYDTAGNVLTATDPAGKVTTYTYDSRHNLLTNTDPLGHVTTRTYDSSNNLLTVTDALGRTTTWTYDSNSLPLTMTLPRGGVYSFTYTSGRLTTVTDPNSVVTNFSYDANGRLLYREDALGKRVTFTYDAVGNVLTVTNALSQVTTYEYDHRNRVKKITDPTSAISQYTYDNNSNVLTSTDALGKVTTYTYDAQDRLKTVVDALSRTTTYNYDDAGRLTSVVAPGSLTTTYAYDAAGQLTSVIDPAGKVTTVAYESRGLLTGVTDPLSRTSNFTYDDAGRRITAKDPLNRQTGLAYDALNRLTQITDPGSLVTVQGFDNDGNRTSLTNPATDATVFAYDTVGRLTSATTPESHATSYTYNSRGLPATVVEPSGHTISFSYDDAQRLSSTTDPVDTISLTRDPAGRVLTVAEGSKTITRVYDALGRLTSYTDGDGNVIGYTYDDIGRLTQLTYPDGKHVNYVYDTAGRLSTVTDWASRVTTYSYDAVDRMTQQLRPNDTKQTRAYDDAGQLTQLTELAPDGTTVIYSGTHGYDAAGQLTSDAISPAITPAVISVTQAFDRDNRLLTHNGATTTFDADGNLLSVASGLTPAAYTYDARNRLTSAGGLTYTYDAENRRVALTDSNGTTHYAINPNAVLDQVLVRTAPDGTRTFYVYGLGLLHEETGSTVRYYHCDRRGDTVALTDGTGTVIDRASYGVYGEILSRTGTTNTPFLFNGQWGVQTEASGIYYHRARYYHPQLRRFLNQDPIGFEGGINFYAYAAGNPTTTVDPSGLLTEGEKMQIMKSATAGGAVFGGIAGGIIGGGGGAILGAPTGPGAIVVGGAGAAAGAVEGTAMGTAAGAVLGRIGIVVVEGAQDLISQMGKPTGKEKSTDVPSWVRQEGYRPAPKEDGKTFAERAMDSKYGKGNWSRSDREFSQIKKWGDRAFGAIVVGGAANAVNDGRASTNQSPCDP